MSDRVLIDEHIRPDSRLVRTWLGADGDRIRIAVELDGAELAHGHLPGPAIAHVVRRYARPLDDEAIAELGAATRVELGGGVALACWRWRAKVDADARDYLVLLGPGAEPLAALATTVAGALRFLVERQPG